MSFLPHPPAAHACHTCALPAVCALCTLSCHANHVVSALHPSVQAGCGCPLGAACTQPGQSAARASSHTSSTASVALQLACEFVLSASHDATWSALLTSRCDSFGYVVVSHLLGALQWAGCAGAPHQPLPVPQIVAKGLARSPMFRVTKAGSESVRVVPRHPHVHEVLALAAPYVWAVDGRSHPLGPLPLDRVVLPATLHLLRALGVHLTVRTHSGAVEKEGGWTSRLLPPPWETATTQGGGGSSAAAAGGVGDAATRLLAQACAAVASGAPLPPGVARHVPRASVRPSIPRCDPPPAISVTQIASLSAFEAWVAALLTPGHSGVIALKLLCDRDGEVVGYARPERKRVRMLFLGTPQGEVAVVDVAAMATAGRVRRDGGGREAQDGGDSSGGEGEGGGGGGSGEDGWGALLHPLLPLLLDPTLLKVMHDGSEDVMWLARESGLAMVAVWDTRLGVDEAIMHAARCRGGMDPAPLAESGTMDRASYYTLRYTPALAPLLWPALPHVHALDSRLAHVSCLHDVLWPGVEGGGERPVAGDTFPLSLARTRRMVWDVSRMIPAASAVQSHLAAGGEPGGLLAAALSTLTGERGAGAADGAPLARAILRSHLTVLRVPPYDAFQRLVLPVPMPTPAWYLACKSCGGRGHFQMDCPSVGGAFTSAGVP